MIFVCLFVCLFICLLACVFVCMCVCVCVYREGRPPFPARNKKRSVPVVLRRSLSRRQFLLNNNVNTHRSVFPSTAGCSLLHITNMFLSDKCFHILRDKIYYT